MLVDTKITIAIPCESCDNIKIYEISLFNFVNTKNIEFKCDCGEANAVIKTEDYKMFWANISCAVCQDVHVYKYKLSQLIKGNIVIRCIDTGIEICFIGKNEDVEDLIEKYEKKSEEMLKDLGFYDFFKDFDAMMNALTILRNMDREDRIYCDCGNDDIKLELFTDSVEFRCPICNSVMMISVENRDDVEALMEKEEIVLHKSSFECIHSVINTDLNKK
ncbi:hypothetical protein [Thermohalobacter berrensis]|uniref:Uncharacterized protein n=1 Tax=Thermohalobacter berrensis TaxID=99594 RepID=A0A419T7I9_9FIRM|nr:hypothetical protein [Thermohalobacter berrensis]RKD33524.1 hypothetical protein BET03_09050 [Thermohalobacter berrensis]